MSELPPLTYAEAGVSLAAADAVVDRLRAAVESTKTPLVIGSLGGFAGLISAAKFSDPVLAAGTDTVGSKALLQRQMGRLHELGVASLHGTERCELALSSLQHARLCARAVVAPELRDTTADQRLFVTGPRPIGVASEGDIRVGDSVR